jgi:mannose-1-phosphate guanylyltransferase/mannose-1-phosphate guanylyltransferase/mannose-6-phosphate isomerase
MDSEDSKRNSRANPNAYCAEGEAGGLPRPKARILPVILSGGAGSRLWPYSTEDTPKQFLSFIGERSLFQLTLERVRNRRRFLAPLIVASVRHADLCEQSLATEAGDAHLILEPCSKNTAAAIAMAAAVARDLYGEKTLLLIMPSDHLMEDVEAFHAAVSLGEAAARSGHLVTFGIHPSGPDTGYGYLKCGVGIKDAPGVNEVARFIEKPSLELAESMVADAQHLWNAGIFLFEAGAFLEEVMHYAPSIGAAAQMAVHAAEKSGIRITANAEHLASSPSESVDYAVMEHSSRVAVVPMAPGWSDLGSWVALAALMDSARPLGPVTTLDCDDCYIRSDGVQVAALGVRDLIIVASGQRLLILPRGRSQEVKKLLSVMDSMAA